MKSPSDPTPHNVTEHMARHRKIRRQKRRHEVYGGFIAVIFMITLALTCVWVIAYTAASGARAGW